MADAHGHEYAHGANVSDENEENRRALSRRHWLRGLVPLAVDTAAAVVAPMLADRPVRPPGAGTESDFLTLCSRCGDCATACPFGSIFVFSEGQEALSKTPVLFVAERPCRQCEGYPCAAACKAGALTAPQSGQPRLGGVRIQQDRCLPYSGPECGACVGLCPGAQALSLRAGRPQIDAEQCTGCGMCIAACVMSPPAIETTL